MATHTVSTPMATVNAIIFFMLLLALRHAATIAAIISPRTLTAVTPLANILSGTIPSSVEINANMPIEIDILIIIPLILAIVCSFPSFATSIKVTSTDENREIRTTPFAIPPRLTVSRILHAEASRIIETPNERMIPDTFAISCLFPILVTLTNALVNSIKAAIKTIPLPISSTLRVPMSLHTPTSMANAMPILINIVPALLTLLPELLATEISDFASRPKAPIKMIPLVISLESSLPMSFISRIKIRIATAIFLSIFPTLSTSAKLPPLENSLAAAINMTRPLKMAAAACRPCSHSLSLMEPSILTANAAERIARPTIRILSLSFVNDLAFLSNVTVVDAILLASVANTSNTPANTVTTPTASYRLS